MKKSYPKIVLVLIAALLTTLAVTEVGKISIAGYHYLLFWLITFLFLKYAIGFPKDKHIYKTDILQIVFIYTALFVISTYLVGIFTGFLKSSYNLELFKIIENSYQTIILIILMELTRYMIANKGSLSIRIMLIITFIICDIMLGFNSYTTSGVMGIFELIGLLIIPAIFNNLILSYITIKGGYKPAILYRLILEVPVYILPFFPDLGSYLEIISYILFITLLFIKLNTFLSRQKENSNKNKVSPVLFWMPTLTFLLAVAFLISGLFKFYALAVASASMHPSFDKGDIIVVERATAEGIKALEIGDIIAYEYDQRIIVHRIINIFGNEKKPIFQTKGDNNKDPDAYYIEEKKIRGLVKLKIKYVGYPSIWFSELIS